MANISIKVYEASWCKPCQRTRALLEKVDNPSIDIQFYDIEKVGRKGITNLPTIYISKNGEEIDKIIGELYEEDIEKIINCARPEIPEEETKS